MKESRTAVASLVLCVSMFLTSLSSAVNCSVVHFTRQARTKSLSVLENINNRALAERRRAGVFSFRMSDEAIREVWATDELDFYCVTWERSRTSNPGNLE